MSYTFFAITFFICVQITLDLYKCTKLDKLHTSPCFLATFVTSNLITHFDLIKKSLLFKIYLSNLPYEQTEIKN